MIGLLRSVWNAPAASPPPLRRVWRDWALVAALAPIALFEGTIRTDLPVPALSVLVTLALLPTLLWRRTRPLLMLAVAFGVAGLMAPLIGYYTELHTSVFLLLLTYAVFRWGSGRATAFGLAIMLATLGLSDLLGRTAPGDEIGALAVVLATVSLGLVFRYRAGLRARELDQAKSLERERLARDLHDTVAHHVSAIAIRAQAGLATAPGNPEAAIDALRVIEAEASLTLAEMRTMVRVLRRDAAPELVPGPRVADLTGLAGAGLGGPIVAVRLAGDLDGLPPTVAAAVYRLAQESVTNARRHARHATRIDLTVEVDDTGVTLSVRDDGDAGLAPAPAPAPGYGITGMIERAALLGGTCQAGRAPGRGWAVTATLPRTGWST